MLFLDEKMNIQTSSHDIFSDGKTEVIHIRIERKQNGKDLCNCEFRAFYMHPDTQQDCSYLQKTVNENSIDLIWCVTPKQTGKYYFNVVALKKFPVQGMSYAQPKTIWKTGFRYFEVFHKAK